MTTVPQIIEADKPLSALTLGQLAHQANEAHAGAQRLGVDMVMCAIRAGAALSEAKLKLPHGQWLPWLEESFNGVPRQAQRYIKAFKNQDKLPSNTTSKSFLDGGLSGFLKMLTAGNDIHVANNSGEVEWYTPPEYIEAARKVMGGIDLDPASCEAANKTVQADRFYSKKDDGLTKEWRGHVWMNPPYASGVVDAFADKLAAEAVAGRATQACVLVNNATETEWFQALTGVASAVCFPSRRVKFLDREGNPVGAPLQGQAVIYIGKTAKAFVEEFSKIGMCWVKP